MGCKYRAIQKIYPMETDFYPKNVFDFDHQRKLRDFFLDDTGEGGTTAASATSIHSSRHVCKYHIYIFIIYNGPRGMWRGQHFIERGQPMKMSQKNETREK